MNVKPHVLVVSPRFFGYETEIVREFERQGCITTFVDERPSNNSFIKAISRVVPRLLARATRRHFSRALGDLAKKPPVDLVLVIKAELMPTWFLDQVTASAGRCVRIFYSFDSFKNSPRGQTLLSEFDYGYSFDRDDVEEIRTMIYKPLFHTSHYELSRRSITDRTYDVSFVGTVHSDRWTLCQAVFSCADRVYGFFYSPARWHLALQRLKTPALKTLPPHMISFAKLDRYEVAEVFGASRAVLDVQRTGQSGLTMRTFEVLAAGSKLITTNTSIKFEDFYDPAWIYVLPRDPSDLASSGLTGFLNSETAPPNGLMDKYSLEHWVAGFLAHLSERKSRP